MASSYHVGWICAIRTEYVVACELLDEEFQTPPLAQHDDNAYTCGRIGKHKVVVACLPQGRYGLASAAIVANNMLRSFPAIQFGLMVGIGGGAPSAKHDIRLGDVVVSSPTGRTGGVIHYEFGKNPCHGHVPESLGRMMESEDYSPRGSAQELLPRYITCPH